MRTRAAVLRQAQLSQPYVDSCPLIIEELELEPPGPGEVLVEVRSAGLCHSDLSAINGTIGSPLPAVLGHEASGIVREVGAGVTEFQPDDHVVFTFVPTCGHCFSCVNGRPALCENGSRAFQAGTLLRGSRPFQRADGQHLAHFLGVSGFSQYTVVAQESLVKIEKSVPLEKAALFGCALVTGVGAVLNTAQVQAGEAVAIFGLGGVGLSALMGAKLVGASPIIAVDILPTKFLLAKRLGADYTLAANEADPVAAIRDLTQGGVAYAFEAVGNADVLLQAFKATRSAGRTIAIGIAPGKQYVSIQALSLVALEKTLQGSYMGSAVPRRDIPRLIDLYLRGKLPVDELLSPSITLDEINTGFDRLAQGSVIRQLVYPSV